MSSKSDTSSKEGREESFFTLESMQQQFERINVAFNEILDRINRQDIVTSTWREGCPQRFPNAKRQEG